MTTLDWATVLEVAAGVAAGSVPVALTYLLNERSSRSQLGREQEYLRRRESYERVLTALKLQRTLTESVQGFARFQQANPPTELTPPEAGSAPTAPGIPNELILYFSKLFVILNDVLTGNQTPSISPADLMDAKPEDRRRVAGIVSDTIVRGLARAALEVDSACRSLLLADGSDEFLERASSLHEKLALGTIQPNAFIEKEFDWPGIDSEINDLALIALQDLKEILGERIEIELVRTTALRSVHVSSKKRRGPRKTPNPAPAPPT